MKKKKKAKILVQIETFIQRKKEAKKTHLGF